MSKPAPWKRKVDLGEAASAYVEQLLTQIRTGTYENDPVEDAKRASLFRDLMTQTEVEPDRIDGILVASRLRLDGTQIDSAHGIKAKRGDGRSSMPGGPLGGGREFFARSVTRSSLGEGSRRRGGHSRA